MDARLTAPRCVPSDTKTDLQDWIKGRHSEVDDINGLVAATHRSLARRAPVNEAVVQIAYRIERREIDPWSSNLAPLAEAARDGCDP